MMVQELAENNGDFSSQRPFLKRSKTINISGNGNSIEQTNDEREESILGDSVPEKPKSSSCQALRHAVSSLTRIDDFHLEELGSGFFGNVYKATHKTSNNVMVMKINKDVANRHCALREVQLMNKMHHPNILRFLGVCVHEGQLHSLTEFIDGGNLEELLADKSEELPWTVRIKMSLDIAQGLSYVHQLGFIHRDLTSRNVLIKKGDKKNFTAVIADFGLAVRIPEPNSQRLIPVGSPWWIAPEVIMVKFYDERADLFSFGIINMELTTRIESDPDIMPRTHNFGVDYHKICELVDYCPLDFLQLAFKCCQVQPERRPSAKVIVNTLEKIYTNLISDSVIHLGKGHKRSKSEDNILQCNDSFSEDSLLMTAEYVAQVMSADDPDYSPALVNPFANISQLRYGHKLVDFHLRRISIPSSNTKNGTDNLLSVLTQHPELNQHASLSLPSSPVMLRKAAEKRHQVSLHGANAIKTESKPDLLLRVCSDESQDSSRDFSASERQLQFKTNRTRSLGSLDFMCHGSKSKNAHGHRTSTSLRSDLNDVFNNSHEILRESSFENILDDEESEMNSESEEKLGCDFNQGNCNSLASESYRTAVNYQAGGEDNTDVSDISTSNSGSSYASVSDTAPVSVSVVNGEEKPLIAVQNGSYSSNHF